MKKSLVLAIGIVAVLAGLSFVYIYEVKIPPPKALEGHYHAIQVDDKIVVGEKPG